MSIKSCFYNPVQGLEPSPIDLMFSDCMIGIYVILLLAVGIASLIVEVEKRKKIKINGGRNNVT